MSRTLVETQGPVLEDSIEYTINTYVDGMGTIVEIIVFNTATNHKVVKEHRCFYPTTFGMDVDDIQSVNDLIDFAIQEAQG